MSIAPIKLKLPGDNDFFTEEAYKVLRTNLMFCGQDIRVIMITSCNENDGKTTVALHIAKSFAELDKKVLLVDSDMRKSVMAVRNTSVNAPSGLSEVLTGMCSISECLYPVEDLKMHILFAGQCPPNPVELLNGKYFEALISECRKVYDYIIVDTPPLGQVIDAAVVAEKCDGAVMVLGKSKVHYRDAQEIVDQIQKSGCKMLGVVRNNPKTTLRRRGYYKYYRHDSTRDNRLNSEKK